MEVRAVNIDKKPLRAFYRIYILPQHIEHREGRMQKVLEDELAEHKAYVKENNLQAQLKEYIADQKARQKAYDEMQRLKGELAVLQGTDLNKVELDDLPKHADKLKQVSSQFVEAQERFAELKEAFPAKWH